MRVLQKSVENAAAIIKKHEYARVISHYDADGITSAGIICNALLRRGMRFHATIVSKLERPFIRGLNEDLIIICDMGTAQLELVNEYLKEKDVVIIDHHAPIQLTSAQTHLLNAARSSFFSSPVLINPYCDSTGIGIGTENGATDGDVDADVDVDLDEEQHELVNERGSTISAAGLSYLVARCISDDERGKGNIDLAGLAVAGTLGDKLEFNTGLNRMILDEALQEGVISVKTGLKLGDGKIRDLIFFATDPYIPLAGKIEWIDAFLNRLDIERDKNSSDLTDEEEKRLTTPLLSLIQESQPDISDDVLVGARYIFHFEVIQDGMRFMRLIDACGRLGKSGIGIGLCLREGRLVDEAGTFYASIQEKLLSELTRIDGADGVDAIKELKNISYFFVQERGVTGILAGIVADYLCTDKPVIVLNQMEPAEYGKKPETKVSARCNKKLLLPSVPGRINLAKALEKASREVGGYGGGHPIAAGASIPKKSEEKFIAVLDMIMEEQRSGLDRGCGVTPGAVHNR